MLHFRRHGNLYKPFKLGQPLPIGPPEESASIQETAVFLFIAQLEHAFQVMFAILPKGNQRCRVDDPFDGDHVLSD